MEPELDTSCIHYKTLRKTFAKRVGHHIRRHTPVIEVWQECGFCGAKLDSYFKEVL